MLCNEKISNQITIKLQSIKFLKRKLLQVIFTYLKKDHTHTHTHTNIELILNILHYKKHLNRNLFL